MSCFLTSGQVLGCADSIGGLKKVYIAGSTGTTGSGYFTDFDYDVDDAITGATGQTGTTLIGFELKRNTSQLTQNIVKSYENGTVYFEMLLEMSLFKYDVDKRNAMKVLSQNDTLQIIAIDNNNNYYMVGQVNKCYLQSGNATSGLALGDKNGFTWTFQAQEADPARLIVSAGQDPNDYEAFLQNVFYAGASQVVVID